VTTKKIVPAGDHGPASAHVTGEPSEPAMTAVPRPEPPPSHLVRAAKDRLLAALQQIPADADSGAPTLPVRGGEVVVSDEPTPWPGPARVPADAGPDARYEFGEVFAAGGLGLVRRARDRRLGRTVAVKELLRNDPAAERRFALEAAITARLQHPGIIPLYDIGRRPGGEPYYCMKLVDGESLEQKIRGCAGLPERLALLEHIIAAADAVAHAHRHGVIHRDLKPANILVGERGETVVIDWGLAKDTTGTVADEIGDLPASPSGTSSTMTEHGTVLGTLRYMSPEQARGEPVDVRGDVFALGASLYHVLAGVPPHEGIQGRALVTRIAEGGVDELRTPDLPRELVAIVERATAARPEDRYASAEAFADDLRRFRTGRLVGAHRYSAREVMSRWLRRHRAVTAVAGAGLVALSVGGAIAVQNIRDERDRAAAAEQQAVQAQLSTEDALQRSRAQTGEAVIAHARGALATNLAATLALLARTDLSDRTFARRARLLALAAESRGAPARVLRGHERPISLVVALPGGELVSVDGGGGVRRWEPDTGEGSAVFDLAEQHVELVAARDVPAFAAIGATRAHVVRADGSVEVVDVSAVPRGVYDPYYRWELSAGGETLAALGEPMNVGEGAPAYLWDLRARPAIASQAPGVRAGVAALRPDGRAVAYDVAGSPAMLYEDGVAAPIRGLGRALGFSSSGAQVYGFPTDRGDGPRMVTVDVATGALHELDRWAFAAARDDQALTIHFAEFVERAVLSLRSLATGEARWDLKVDSYNLGDWGDHGDFDVLVDPRGDGLALRARDHWRLGSLAAGALPRRLDVGESLRGAWIDGGGFVLARQQELWVWGPSPADPLPADLSFAALAPDGARAVAYGRDESPVLVDLSSGAETAAACLAGLTVPVIDDVDNHLALDSRGRVLFADKTGRACVQDLAGAAHPLQLPATPTAIALVEGGEGFVVGLADGGLLRWASPVAAPSRLDLGTGVFVVTALLDDAGMVAITSDGKVVAARDGAAATIATIDRREGMTQRIIANAIAVDPRRPAAAIALPGEDALLRHDFATGVTDRRTLLLPDHPALAFSPEGRLAVALAGPRLLVLDDGADGRGLVLPEEARALAWLDEQQLAIVGSHGSLLRADLEADEATVLRHDWTSSEGVDTAPTLIAGPTGAATLFTRNSFRVDRHPADPVPTDPARFAAWLQARVATFR
jgi:tRNA A-37 threonylcarbamoyl transferase component Bud32